MLDSSQARNNLSAQRDRITQLLTQSTQPQSKVQSGFDLGSALLSALSTNTGAAGVEQSYNEIQKQRQLEQQNQLKGHHDLYKLMQDEVNQGNEDAVAVDKAIKDITGNDIGAYTKIASQLHNSPEPVNRQNATLLASKAASQMGYKPIAFENEKLGMQKTKAEINKLNAEAQKARTTETTTKEKTNQLPTSALKLQNEALEQIGLANGINADLGAVKDLIEENKLKLGPVENLKSNINNYLGKSTESSRNFASFRATLEKLRNDSLKLNKGTQTEGDAVRAWNELFKNLNDKAVVQQRLDEIQRINQRASQTQELNVSQIRRNFGLEDLDLGGYKNKQPSIKSNNNNFTSSTGVKFTIKR